MRSIVSNSILAATLSLATVLLAQNPTDLTTPPPSQHAILTLTGNGVQIYRCKSGPTGSPQWIFDSPEATLSDASGHPAGTHGAGPIWKSIDGSSVKGELLQKSESPEPASPEPASPEPAIPWLLLKAISPTGSGIFSKAEFIRRSDTHGGTAPATGCDPQHLNAISRVPYTATYTFYSRKP
jgi:hypothetical protein